MRPGGAREGFTLVETLVALAVVAAVSVALQRGFVSTRQALARAEAITAAEAVARDILENRLDRLAARVGTEDGRQDGLNFTVTSEPLDLPFPTAPSPEPPRERPPAQAAPANTSEAPGPAGQDAGEAPVEDIGRWIPLRVTIRIEPASGPPLTVETVHVARAP